MSGAETARASHLTSRHDFVRRFWNGEAGLAGRILNILLMPAQVAYHMIIALRNFAYDRGLLRVGTAPMPVVSVGNLSVGGTGKTPFTAWVVDQMERRGTHPAILHGGYGDDEPTLHRRWHPDVPVEAGRDRVSGAKTAAARGADVAVLDDGFQHRRLARQLDIVLIAAEDWTRDMRLLPRGPWREPVAALRRADIIVITRRTMTGPMARRVALDVEDRIGEKPIAIAYLRPAGWTRGGRPIGPPDRPALALAAIARPERFVTNAEEAGARIAEVMIYPDHHAFTRQDAQFILDRAGLRPIVTTAKDAVKLVEPMREDDVWVLEQVVEFDSGEDWLQSLLDQLVT